MDIADCRLELEDRGFLAGLRSIPRAFKSFARPETVGVAWHKTEDQGQIGSCQGNALTSCMERLQYVATGNQSRVVQLSRIFAYLATQKIDKDERGVPLIGRDVGSTISGGGKVASEHGVCPESLTNYPPNYPGSTARNAILSQANYEAAKPFRVASLWQVPEDPEEARNWIGGGGAISIGIQWPGIPDDRRIRSYRGGQGGHAVAVLGYEPGWLIAVNSWGDGPFWISDDAWRQMHRYTWNAMLGLAGDVEPQPKRVDIRLDW